MSILNYEDKMKQPLPKLKPRKKHTFNNRAKVRETKGTLAADFMHQLFEHWKIHGINAIAEIYETDKKAYVDTILRALPKQIVIEHDIIQQLSHMSDAELGVDLGFLNGHTTPMALIEGEGAEEAH